MRVAEKITHLHNVFLNYFITISVSIALSAGVYATTKSLDASNKAHDVAIAVQKEDVKLGKLGCDAVSDNKKVLHDLLMSGSGTLPMPPLDLPPSLLHYIAEIAAANAATRTADLEIIDRPSPLCDFANKLPTTRSK